MIECREDVYNLIILYYLYVYCIYFVMAKFMIMPERQYVQANVL